MRPIVAILAAWSVASMTSTSAAESVVSLGPDVLTDRTRVIAFPQTAYQPIESRQSSTAAGTFNANMIFLADQLDRNKDPDVGSKPVIITSFSNLDNFSETTTFGRLLGEQLMHELKVRGWQLVDMRVTKSVIINPAGEFSLSRDLGRIRESFPAGNVLVGTYVRTSDGVLVSARVIDVASGHVQSTAQSRFLRDRFTVGLVSVPVAYPTVRVGN